MEAYEEKKGMTIKMSKTQLAHNMKIEGRCLPAFAGLIPFLTGTVLPALGFGALSGLASTGVQKLIGNGLYLKKGFRVCQIEPDGSGLNLGPTNAKGFETVWNGHYLSLRPPVFGELAFGEWAFGEFAKSTFGE